MEQSVGVRLSPSAPFPPTHPSPNRFLMQATTLSDIFTHPSFITILTTILIVITNIMIGVSMLPSDTRRKRYPMHRGVYVAALASFGFFLWVTHRTLENSIFNYLVFMYFLTVIPLSRRLNVTLHAVLASIGLDLLVGVATFTIL